MPSRRVTFRKSTTPGLKGNEDDKESKPLKNKQKINNLSKYTREKGLPSRTTSSSKKRKEEDDHTNDLLADSETKVCTP